MDTNRSNAKEHSDKVSLSNGSTADIETKEGANVSPKGDSTLDQHFSSKLKELRKLRKKERRNARDEKKLEELYKFIFEQAISPAKFSQSQIQEWLKYNIEEMKGFTKKQDWIKGGFLDTINDYYKMLSFCDVTFIHQPALVSAALESEFFEVLANFIKARKGNGRALPTAHICGSIGRIVSYAFTLRGDSSWSMDKIFKKFEACGILEQILRCSTVGESELEAAFGSHDNFDLILEKLQSCTILTRKFKSGEPCGDTLKAILDGRDGSTNIPPKILKRLQGIAKIFETMDTKEFKANLDFDKCIYCFKNGTTEAPLLFCARCRLERYCSKECQKAHWQVHKRCCKKLSKPERDRAYSLAMAMRRFLKQHLKTVVDALKERCANTGVEMTDLAVEIDFMPNKNGIIPALQDPPIFRIALLRDFQSGRDMPEWYKDGRMFNLTGFRNLVKSYEPELPTALVVVHHGGGSHINPLPWRRKKPEPELEPGEFEFKDLVNLLFGGDH